MMKFYGPGASPDLPGVGVDVSMSREGEETALSKSRSVILKQGRNIKYLPHAFNKHGHGFSRSNVVQRRAFYIGREIVQTPSGIFEARAKCPTLSGESEIAILLQRVMDIIGPPPLPDPPRRRIGFGVR